MKYYRMRTNIKKGQMTWSLYLEADGAYVILPEGRQLRRRGVGEILVHTLAWDTRSQGRGILDQRVKHWHTLAWDTRGKGRES